MCTPTPTQPQKEASSTSVVDLGLQIREGGWGGGGFMEGAVIQNLR